MKYTVLLLYPDYMSDSYGQETFLSWEEGNSPMECVSNLQRRLGNEHECDHRDFYPLLVTEGHVADLTER
jgi:hypothetical protein